MHFSEENISTELYDKLFDMPMTLIATHHRGDINICDNGSTGCFQHISDKLNVIESSRFELTEPIEIGLGTTKTRACRGALVEKCTPLFNDPTVGVRRSTRTMCCIDY